MNIKCPHCGAEYDVAENECSGGAKCKVCGKEFVVGASFTKKLGEAATAVKDAAKIAANSVYEKARDIDWKVHGERAKAMADSARDKSREWYRSVRGKYEELGLTQKISQWWQSVKKMVMSFGKDEGAMAEDGAVITENIAGGNMDLMAGGVVASGIDFAAIANEQRQRRTRHTTSDEAEQLSPESANGDGMAFFDVRGRATRHEYWFTVVPITLFMLLLWGILVVYTISARYDRDGIVALFVMCIIGTLICFSLLIPVNIRRLHDRNMSGWFLLAFSLGSLVPFVNIFVSITQFIIMGCLDGTIGPNDFGPDPKGRQPKNVSTAMASTSEIYKEAPEDRLMKLLKLKEAGVLTEEEYEEKRRKILEEI